MKIPGDWHTCPRHWSQLPLEVRAELKSAATPAAYQRALAAAGDWLQPLAPAAILDFGSAYARRRLQDRGHQ